MKQAANTYNASVVKRQTETVHRGKLAPPFSLDLCGAQEVESACYSEGQVEAVGGVRERNSRHLGSSA